MSNTQVTHDTNFNNARAESCLVINPKNPQQIVCASKKFRDIANYDFTLATAYSTDGGRSWQDSSDLVLVPNFDQLTDPALAWDNAGSVFLVGLAGKNPPKFDTLGIVVYKSTDGGKTWGAPKIIHEDSEDDKQWAAGDVNSGEVYVTWQNHGDLRFARTLDHGETWIGTGGLPAGSNLAFLPAGIEAEINVGADGNIYVVYLSSDESEIGMMVSTDKGNSFGPTMHLPAQGITTLDLSLPQVGSPKFAIFPPGNFRVLTTPTACVSGSTVAVAWADYREGVSRIYYALSHDSGKNWLNGPQGSGQPLITASLRPNQQHFHPQLVADPNGVIGCAFYEFGPKPTAFLIDVILATSFDRGASFDFFTVTDQAWDPAVHAPHSHGNDNLTFIGEYFGLDASAEGFYPLWTDTRTGMQELWMTTAPEKRSPFYVKRSVFGQDEIDLRRKKGRNVEGGLPITDAFDVVVDGFAAEELGVTGPDSTLQVASPVDGMIISPGRPANTPDNGTVPGLQRFTFHYDIDFTDDDKAFHFDGDKKGVSLFVTVKTASASTRLELVKQPDPFILHGDPAWLSVDLRVFVVNETETKFGIHMKDHIGDPPGFIQAVMGALSSSGNGSAGGETFEDNLSKDEEASMLYLTPRQGGNVGPQVFNFALARVHYTGSIPAPAVRVFFRLFQTQTTYVPFDYPPGARYRRAIDNPPGHAIALAGIEGNEYVTIPCFAEQRKDSTQFGMDQQTDTPNVHDFVASEANHFYGCWLDINQPSNTVLPIKVPPMQDGPFNLHDPNPDFRPVAIQQAILRNLHQCLIAEIAFDPVPIPPGRDPSDWDKLAQRNLVWSRVGSAPAVSTFEIHPTPSDLTPDLMPDELVIDWGSVPSGSLASIYIPTLSVDDILATASRMYTSHRLVRIDNNTLQCQTGGITYIPIPKGGTANHVGLLSIDLSGTLPQDQVFNVVVRQVTNVSESPPPASPSRVARRHYKAADAHHLAAETRWRQVLGTFQLTIPVRAKDVLLEREEQDLSVLRWIFQSIPSGSRWAPVSDRYIKQIAARVEAFGGDPSVVGPSPTGDWYHPADGMGALVLTFVGESGESVSDVADIFLKHFVLSDQRVIRRWPTTQLLVVRDLIGTHTGIYELQVLSDHHEAVGQFVTIRDGETTELKVLLKGSAPALAAPKAPAETELPAALPKESVPESSANRNWSGKVSGLIFDHFGSFAGFLLESDDGERKFLSREKDMEELVERCWRERLHITVWVQGNEGDRPMSIIVREPPVSFGP